MARGKGIWWFGFAVVCVSVFLAEPVNAETAILAQQPDNSAIAYYYSNWELGWQCHSVRQTFIPAQTAEITRISIDYRTSWGGQKNYPYFRLYEEDGTLIEEGPSTDFLNGGIGYFSTLGTWVFSHAHVTSSTSYYWKFDWCDHGNWWGFGYPSRVYGAGPEVPYYVVEGEISEPPREPVIIVPGIMGTRLNRVSDGEEVWPNISEAISSSNDSFLDDLKLDSRGQEFIDKRNFSNSVVEVATGTARIPILDIDVHINRVVYDNLVSNFTNVGYLGGVSLFLAPFDWRLSAQAAVNQLSQVIMQAVQSSPTGKVNIIAHSMGGLLVKQYLASIPGIPPINKVILLGSPQIGSPKAFKILNHGDNLDFTWGPLEFLNPSKAKEISQNMPSVYELLPSRRYIAVNGGYVYDFRSDGPRRALDFDETKAFMLADESDKRNDLLLELADQFHGNLDNDPVNGQNIYNIVGCQNPETLSEFRIYDDDVVDIGTVNGDGTVPLVSAMNLANDYQNYFVRYDQTGINHQGLVKDSRTVGLIADIIGGSVSTLPQGVSTSTSYCFTDISEFRNETTIAVSTHSPVALHVYDSQDHHTGPLPNGDIELGIPGSDYERIGENSFAFMPAGDSYRFVADGLGAGSFDMKIRAYKGSNLANTITYLNVPLADASTTAEVDFINSRSPANLRLDSDGDGLFDVSVPPTAILDAQTSMDIVPPVIIIQSPTSTEYARSAMIPLTTSIVDDSSGTAFEETKLDGTVVTSTVIDSFFLSLGEHTVSVHAADNVGNPANATTSFYLIATPESAIADVERAYALGWITKESVKKSLVSKLRLATQLEKRIEILQGKLPDRAESTEKIEAMAQQTGQLFLELFLKDLEMWYNKGAVNKQALDLIQENIDWLLGESD